MRIQRLLQILRSFVFLNDDYFHNVNTGNVDNVSFPLKTNSSKKYFSFGTDV